jgi:hypothetical protein
MNASGAFSRPFTTVSVYRSFPSATHWRTSRRNSGISAEWSPERAERADRRLQVIAADVVEVDVDAVRRGGRELLGDGGGVVVERHVETEVLDEVRHLFG